MQRFLVLWFFSFLVALAMSCTLLAGDAPVVRSTSKRVLILYTHRQMSPINTQWHAGIIEAIRRDYQGPIDIDVEYM
ncbi:MAG: hypothetical protein ACKO9Q_18705, partial [Pirellula sp.]